MKKQKLPFSAKLEAHSKYFDTGCLSSNLKESLFTFKDIYSELFLIGNYISHGKL